ncbi:uncharacterized protein LOC130721356 [Lotus japonicus]|uniref:uncharacterized protein LOC130721356 n=1 Tax=Lotus japonicus TaxID=34305 RepID=UPI0025834810|nr:uncharacterized protein LOC130721356 [Lotus japonicus]
MVCSGSKELERRTMAMGPERSKLLHNFALPCSWGAHRTLRCMKLDGDHHRSPPPPSKGEPESNVRDSSEKRRRMMGPRIRGGDDEIGAVREKLMLDLKTEADRMKDAIFRKEVAAADGERPWNLRTRRAACKAPAAGAGESGKGLRIEEKPAMRTPNGGAVKSPKLRKMKFSLGLSKEEIEEDFMKLLGHRPPRRPKKRPRNVQKHVESIFPGSWLPKEVTADSYKIETPEDAKR